MEQEQQWDFELEEARKKGFKPDPLFSATGKNQYVQPYTFLYNGTETNAYVWCASTFADPTRHKVRDGLFGRANGSIEIAIPRPKRPGWDGCRTRQDGKYIIGRFHPAQTK